MVPPGAPTLCANRAVSFGALLGPEGRFFHVSSGQGEGTMAGRLKPIGELFSATWERYKRRALPILAVILLSSLVAFAVALGVGFGLVQAFGGLQAFAPMFQGGGLPPSPSAIFAVLAGLVLVGTLFGLWSQSAIMAAAVLDEVGVLEAMRVGYRRMWSVAWVLFLVSAILMAGTVALVFPAILFGVWFAFGVVVLFAEERRGLDALFASRAYVRGHWWAVFGRLLLIGLLSGALGLVPVVGQLLSLLFTPFFLLFLVVLYENLQEAAGGAAEPEGRRLVWGGIAAAGALLPLAGMAAAVAPQWPMIMQGLQGKAVCSLPTRRPAPRPAAVSRPGATERKAAGQEASRAVAGDGRPGAVRKKDQGGADRPQAKAAAAAAQPATSVQWADPAGDALVAGKRPALDVTAVGIAAGRDRLSMAVQLATPVEVFFRPSIGDNTAAFAHLLTLLVDTDNDPATGSVPDGRLPRGGYERAVALAVERAGPDRGRVHFSVYRLERTRWTAVRALAQPLQQEGKMLTFGLPYEAVGITAGSRVRLCFLEGAQQEGNALSDDAVLVAP